MSMSRKRGISNTNSSPGSNDRKVSFDSGSSEDKKNNSHGLDFEDHLDLDPIQETIKEVSRAEEETEKDYRSNYGY